MGRPCPRMILNRKWLRSRSRNYLAVKRVKNVSLCTSGKLCRVWYYSIITIILWYYVLYDTIGKFHSNKEAKHWRYFVLENDIQRYRKHPSFDNIKILNFYGSTQGWEKYPEFTSNSLTFMFVRHPFERILSAFRDKLEDPKVRKTEAERERQRQRPVSSTQRTCFNPLAH